MFVGEMGCWLVIGIMSLRRRFSRSKSPVQDGYQAINTSETDETVEGPSEPPGDTPQLLEGRRILLLSLPAICDICGTTLMNIGLLLVVASVYQMTRGALVLFVGLFSVMFLRRHLHLFQWLSLIGVVLGVAVVGLAGAISPDDATETTDTSRKIVDQGSDALKAIIGVLLIAGAQIFTATQFVLEEWILENSTIEPIRVVGWEGIFGFIVTVFAMAVLHFTVGRTEAGRHGYFDAVDGLTQMVYNRQILVSSVLIMISIG
jgi:drug/metabolite transporter (DMT)-like permease